MVCVFSYLNNLFWVSPLFAVFYGKTFGEFSETFFQWMWSQFGVSDHTTLHYSLRLLPSTHHCSLSAANQYHTTTSSHAFTQTKTWKKTKEKQRQKLVQNHIETRTKIPITAPCPLLCNTTKPHLHKHLQRKRQRHEKKTKTNAKTRTEATTLLLPVHANHYYTTTSSRLH